MKKLLVFAAITLMVMANVFAGGSGETSEATADSPVTLKVANYALRTRLNGLPHLMGKSSIRSSTWQAVETG